MPEIQIYIFFISSLSAGDWHAKGGVLLIGYDMFRLMVQDDELRKKAKKPIVDEQSLNKQLETLSEEKKLKILGEERFRRGWYYSTRTVQGFKFVSCNQLDINMGRAPKKH